MSGPDPHQVDAGQGGQTLWHGRFEGGPAAELMAYTESLSFDKRLWPDDIEGSRAHVRGLARVGIISEIERDQVLIALDVVANEMESGLFVYLASDEDIHTAVERRVTELAGPAGAKLHTGRSRNDQSATDVRLWCKRELMVIARRVLELQRVLLRRAEDHEGVYLPGYTHLQRAQPVLLAHHLMAHGWALGREIEAIDFLAKAADEAGLAALEAAAIERGDVFLLRRVSMALGREAGPERWRALADSATRAGRLRDAESAVRLAAVDV